MKTKLALGWILVVVGTVFLICGLVVILFAAFNPGESGSMGGEITPSFWTSLANALMEFTLELLNVDWTAMRAGIFLVIIGLIIDTGGIYLLLRYAGDQYGEQIFWQMVQTSHVGTRTLEYVTGEPFLDTFADWLATLYLTGKTITSNSRYHYSSTHTIANFDVLRVLNRNVSEGIYNGFVFGTSGDFLLYHNPSPPALEFILGAGSSNAILRAIVVRTQ